uniref:Uncharacterized protein n=1 Tax=Rhizophora mucronata TaxID=61149 RepID=A0A2P2QA15_RHIMU
MKCFTDTCCLIRNNSTFNYLYSIQVI